MSLFKRGAQQIKNMFQPSATFPKDLWPETKLKCKHINETATAHFNFANVFSKLPYNMWLADLPKIISDLPLTRHWIRAWVSYGMWRRVVRLNFRIILLETAVSVALRIDIVVAGNNSENYLHLWDNTSDGELWGDNIKMQLIDVRCVLYLLFYIFCT